MSAMPPCSPKPGKPFTEATDPVMMIDPPSLTLRIDSCGIGVDGSGPGARIHLGGPRQCLRVDILPDVPHNLDILFDAHRNLSFSLSSSVSDLIGRFGTILLGPNHTVDDRSLLLLEQILEDELTPSAAACVHQRAPLVELSQLDGREPEFFSQIRHGSDRVLVVARQKDAPR